MADDEIKELRAVAHPVRLRIMSLLTGTAMSAAEVARELDLTHANASYHLRLLHESNSIVEAGEERIRGGVAKRYRYPHEDRGQRRQTVTKSRIPELRALARELERRLRQRKRTGRNHYSDLEAWVPPEVHDRVRALLMEASLLLHDNNRPPRTPGTVHVSASSWIFEMTRRARS
ncbi:ArsR/SmtB family transcription factor [Kribbella italica]|uniref:DNA-binding transcriptional ArsR family regulator n=1 Tax=Kribbella italica TaxID=1540520 RepID=A0A7W9MU84_9ACTN|nr:helix-turn-helix domain-containing protein [Kribbella italica]MBB5836566.1 DNA-binding transcriptional ArsR family regulator [Kribbella italica]